VKDKAIEFMRENPMLASEQYMTADGTLLKELPAHPSSECPASCFGQYQALNQELLYEQFTSIIKCTKHGIQRLIERGFTPQEVKDLVERPDFLRIQNDGGKVFIKKFGEKYSILIFSDTSEKLITAIKDMSWDGLVRHGKGHGWSLT
jgi:hypothetical protein